MAGTVHSSECRGIWHDSAGHPHVMGYDSATQPAAAYNFVPITIRRKVPPTDAVQGGVSTGLNQLRIGPAVVLSYCSITVFCHHHPHVNPQWKPLSSKPQGLGSTKGL
jgi:hypothetical protein